MASGGAAVADSESKDVWELNEKSPSEWDASKFELKANGTINKAKAPRIQPHFEVVIDSATNTTTVELREELDAEAAFAVIPLNEGVSGEIVQLFKSIDVDGSGELDEDDFAKLMKDDIAAIAETWATLAEKFDANDDNTVTLSEFRTGFKAYGIEAVLDAHINFEAPFDWTMKEWADEIGRVFNHSVTRECQVLRGWFSQFDGSKGELRTIASRAERLDDRVLLAMYMNAQSETQVARLFGLLDTDGNGTLEAADFAVMSKNVGTASLWNQLKENFDENGDEQISFDEFKRHIANTVFSRIPLGSIPRKDWTWRQVISRLSEWANRMCQEQCKEILTYSVCGEYSSIPVGDVEIDGGSVAAKYREAIASFGCGATLGEPAFPGGEPAPAMGPPRAALHASFGDMISAAQRPAAVGGVAVWGAPGAAAAAAGCAPADPHEHIAFLQAQLFAQAGIIADMRAEIANRPPIIFSVGTSANNMITIQLPQLR